MGLKADKLYTYTLDGLQKSLGFPIPVNEFIETCKKYHKKIVVLIDQIDALSQSMASDRNYLNVFRSFIDQFTKDNSVRIIISIRPYELYYDPSLRIYKNMPTFELEPLSESEVLSVISKINVKKESISPKLFELLKVPNHLNIFVRVVADGEISMETTSIQSLYLELWNRKVINIPSNAPLKKNNLKSVLYQIADQMFSLQRITISALKFEDYQSEINYLESERLLKREGKQLQFFHQSFYDFVFAKQFVESTKDIIEYIKQSDQSIQIRPALKMIISYLRDFDELQYEEILKQVFEDGEILFHIKHVLFSIVISQNSPTKAEIDLVKQLVRDSIHLQLLFFELGTFKVWFDLALEEELLNVLKTESIQPTELSKGLATYRKQVALFFLRNYIVRENTQETWIFLKSVGDDKIIQEILFSVENWNNPISFELFERCVDFEIIDPFGFYHVLDNIAKCNEDYAINIISKIFPSHFQKSKSDRNFEEKEVLKTLARACPHKLFPVLFNCIEIDLRKELNYDNKKLIVDWKYQYVELNDTENIIGSAFIYQLLAVCLRRTAKSYPEYFTDFFEEHKNSKYQAVLRILVFSLNENENLYYSKIFNFFQILFESELVSQVNDLGFEIRSLIRCAFNYFEPHQKYYVISKIKNYRNRQEIFSYEYGDPPKKHFKSHWGLDKYYWLLSLPREVVARDQDLHRCQQELERKFGNRKEIRRNGSVLAGTVYSPIITSAFQYMTNKQWIKAFKKYNNNKSRNGEDFLKGGLDELASAFRKIVQENPSDQKLELIESILQDSSINRKYAIYGLWGWTEKRNDLKEKTIPLFKTILNDGYGSDATICIDIASNLICDDNNDEGLVKFLIKQALDFRNYKRTIISDHIENKTTSINGLVTAGINTPCGAALRILLTFKDPVYKESIFNMLESILNSASDELRAIVYWKFAYLTNLDKERAYIVFTRNLNLESNIYVIASSIWSLQYMRNINGLELVSAPYERLIESQLLGQDDIYNLFLILYGSYLHNQIGAKHLLLKHLYSNKRISSRAIGEILKHYYDVPNSKEKNDELLFLIIEQISEEDEEDLNINFFNVEHVQITDIKDFLIQYISSPKFKLSEYFIDYLIYQCGVSVQIAIDIFELALDKHIQTEKNPQAYHRSDETAIKFVVGAYDCLHGIDEESKAKRKKLLSSFDLILMDYRLRRRADSILESII